MKLTQGQQDMLDGKYGEGTAYAMKTQVAADESSGAEWVVPTTRAYVALSNQKIDLWFAEKLLNAGARCRVAPTANPGFCLSFLESRNMISPKYADSMQRTHNVCRGLGAVFGYNCTPHIGTNVPSYREVIAFLESSATPYVNSVWGARANRGGANSALCAAVTGFVPEYGLLLDEGREGNILVEVQADMRDNYDYHMLGMMGEKIDNGIPVFTGLPKHTNKEVLGSLGIELNTSGAYGTYHIVGFTPRAPTFEVTFDGKELERKVVTTNEDLQKKLKKVPLEGSRQTGLAMSECPRFTLKEVEYIAGCIRDEKLQKRMWILTSSYVKEMAVRMDLDKTITQAGGLTISDTCPDQPCWGHLNGKAGITESLKCAYYLRYKGIHFVIRDLGTCIEAALIGEVK